MTRYYLNLTQSLRSREEGYQPHFHMFPTTKEKETNDNVIIVTSFPLAKGEHIYIVQI